MAVVPFSEMAQGEGLAFGLSRERLERIARLTTDGRDCRALLDDADLAAAGLQPVHVLRLRRAVRRHVQLRVQAEKHPDDRVVHGWLELSCRSWARWRSPDDGRRADELAAALHSLAATTLKRGRLRLHLTRPDDPRARALGDLAERTEGCDEMPPHRWFAASRAMADGLLALEVLPPEGEAARALPGADDGLAAELEEAVARPVLDAIGRRSEREVLSTAAAALSDLLSRPPISEALACVLADGKRLWAAHLPAGEEEAERADFSRGEVDALLTWLRARRPALVGLAQRGAGASQAGLLQALSDGGLSAEPVRGAGLMTQARALAGPMQAAAAEVAVRRLRDPLAATADLEPQALGLGEYLDRVDPEALRAALADARQVALWSREHGRGQAQALRGMTPNPMVRSLADLRPGLELSGTVVNLTHFGAFVELGLEAQGLIHLSELSESFVKHPSEVVRVGQQVRARVTEVDPARQRIGLSLRPARLKRARPKGRRGEAIRALDDLFKK